MKKAICLTAILLAFISLVSCTLPWEADTLQKEEIVYLVKTVTTHLGTGAVIENQYFYDEHGRTAGYHIYQDDIFLSTFEYGYDDNGYLIYERHSSPLVDYVSETFSQVDEHGRPIAQRYVVRYEGAENVRSWTIEYVDENGSYVERTVIDGVELTQSGDYDEYGNLLRTVNSSGMVTEYTNEYDDKDRLSKVITTVSGSSTLLEYEYSEEGNYTIERLYNADNELMRTREFFYSKIPVYRETEETENNNESRG